MTVLLHVGPTIFPLLTGYPSPLMSNTTSPLTNQGNPVEAPIITGAFWYRESTQEWVLEVNFHIDGYIDSTCRFPGKTKFDALVLFRKTFSTGFSEDLLMLKDDGFKESEYNQGRG